MLNLGSLHVNSFDIWLLAAYALLFVVNIRAALPLALLCAYLLIHSLPFRNFECYIISVWLVFIVATSDIKISSEIRKALACFGVVYLFAALDNFISYHFDIDSGLDAILKPVVVMINSYLLAHLYDDWRRGNAVGFANYCAFCFRWCKIHFIHHSKAQRNKA